jgi:hypothetical protein
MRANSLEETFNKKSISRNQEGKDCIADKAYERARNYAGLFQKRRVDFIVPQKSNAKEKIQDGQKTRSKIQKALESREVLLLATFF